MQLKDFIKSALFDITDAIKECQEEINNGSIISPTNSMAKEKIKAINGDLQISYIDFEVAVTASESVGSNGETKKGIEVSGSALGFNVSGKIRGKSTGAENKQVNENISKIKFSLPIIYPTHQVKERVTHIKPHVGTIG